MSKQTLTTSDTNKLRTQGLLRENEIAFKEGDVIIAEDPVTGERRVINVGNLLLETNRQLLKD